MKKVNSGYNGHPPCPQFDLPGNGFITPDSSSTIEFAVVIAATMQIMDQNNRLRWQKLFQKAGTTNCFA